MGFDWLDSEEFYNLMQEYRHAPVENQILVGIAFQKVKTYIRQIMRQILEQALYKGESNG